MEEFNACLHKDNYEEIAEKLIDSVSEPGDILSSFCNDCKYGLFRSKHKALPRDFVDELILSLPETLQVNALEILCESEEDTAVIVFDCILRGKDRASLECEQLFTAKIVEAVLRGYEKRENSNRVKLYFSNKAVEKWADLSDLLDQLKKFSNERDDSILLAPIMFSVVESCGSGSQWHLLLFKIKESSVYHFHFLDESSQTRPEEIKYYPSGMKIDKSYKSGLYVIQWAQRLLDDHDSDIISELLTSDLQLCNKDIISFLRLDGNIYCSNKYCYEPFDTKEERDNHSKMNCLFTVGVDGRTALFSCKDRKVENIGMLLQRIPKPERETFIMIKDGHKKTALHECKNDSIAKLMINSVSEEPRDSFIMAKDDQGRTALHECENEKCAELLINSISELQRDNFIMERDNDWRTALHECANERIAKLLVDSVQEKERNNFITAKDKQGRTAADISKDEEVIKLLKGYLPEEGSNKLHQAECFKSCDKNIKNLFTKPKVYRMSKGTRGRCLIIENKQCLMHHEVQKMDITKLTNMFTKLNFLVIPKLSDQGHQLTKELEKEVSHDEHYGMFALVIITHEFICEPDILTIIKSSNILEGKPKLIIMLSCLNCCGKLSDGKENQLPPDVILLKSFFCVEDTPVRDTEIGSPFTRALTRAVYNDAHHWDIKKIIRTVINKLNKYPPAKLDSTLAKTLYLFPNYDGEEVTKKSP